MLVIHKYLFILLVYDDYLISIVSLKMNREVRKFIFSILHGASFYCRQREIETYVANLFFKYLVHVVIIFPNVIICGAVDEACNSGIQI